MGTTPKKFKSWAYVSLGDTFYQVDFMVWRNGDRIEFEPLYSQPDEEKDGPDTRYRCGQPPSTALNGTWATHAKLRAAAEEALLEGEADSRYEGFPSRMGL